MGYGVTCSYCGTNYPLNVPVRSGLKIRCARCERLFTVGREGVPGEAPPPTEPSRAAPASPGAAEPGGRLRRSANAALVLGLLSGVLSAIAAVPAVLLALSVLSSAEPSEKHLGVRRRAQLGLVFALFLGFISTTAFMMRVSPAPVRQWNVEADAGSGGMLFALYGPRPQSIERVVASFREGPRAADPRWMSVSVGAETIAPPGGGRADELRVRFAYDRGEWELSIGKDGQAMALESTLSGAGRRVTRKHPAIARPSP